MSAASCARPTVATRGARHSTSRPTSTRFWSTRIFRATCSRRVPPVRPPSGRPRYLRAVAVAGETVLVSASTGPGGRRAALYRTRADGHGEFERCRQGLPEWLGDNVDTHCLAARGATVVVGTGDGRVYASADGGASFERLTKSLPAIQCVALT